MRYFLFAALLPMACLASGQDTSIHVTYSTRAARASEVLKSIGQLGKIDLETTPATQNEVLVISAKDVPLSDLMAKIATVTSGEWKQEGTIYRLIGSATVRRQEARDEIAKRVTRVQKAIDNRIKNDQDSIANMAKAQAAIAEKAKAAVKSDTKDKKKVVVANDESAFPQMPFVSPEETSITHLLKGIDPSVISQIEGSDRFVFSTEPTRTQRSLAADAPEIINELIQKHDSTASDAEPDTSSQLSGLTEQQAEMMKQMMKHRTGKIGRVEKALLIVSSSNGGMMGMGTNLMVELRLYDAKGKVAFTTNSNLQLDDENRFAAMIAASMPDQPGIAGAPKPQTPPQKQTPIEYSEDSKALEDATKGFSGGKFNVKFSRELRQKLFLPSLYDPLSFTDTDEVLAYAKSTGKMLVADLPDMSSTGIISFGQTEKKTVESYTADLKKGEHIVLVPDETFTLIKPATPERARADRLDRMALTTLLQATEQKGLASLDDLAAYASVAPNPTEGGVGTLYLAMFVPGSIPLGIDGFSSWEMLRFYAQLSPDTRQHLATGGKVAMSSLSASQRVALERMTYGAGAQLSIEDPNKKPEDELPSFMRTAFDGGADDYRGEPTEVVPAGLPSDGFYEMKASSEPFAAPVPGSDSSIVAILGVLGPDELALFKMMRSAGGGEAIDAMIPRFQKLRSGESSIYSFTFHLANQVSIKQTLKDHRYGSDSSIFSEDNLPADLKKRVADKTEALKKSPFGAIGSFMGGGGPIHP